MGVKDSFLRRLLGNADKFSDEQVTQTINLLIEHAVKHRASDIHIEPSERFMMVRYRINGTLRGMHKLPIAAQAVVLARLKVLAHLNETETELPQEGNYATLVDEEQFEVQVNTLPVVGGEKVVLHISRRLSQPPTLESLGYWGRGLRDLHHALSRSHGLLLVATPRRSGKTTTLHSMLQMVSTPHISVATVENDIEYHLTGASQTKVRPHHGLTFHDGLQAALNQDPNVIMISSLADTQTATLAVQAAAAGHLVIGGMHGDSATAALTHLRSLSEESLLMATTTRTAISQRLLRRLCPACRERYIPSQEQIAGLAESFGIITAAARRKVHELEQQATAAGIGNNSHVNTTPSGITMLWRANDDGCEACNHTGYQGSVAMCEVLIMHDDLQKALLDHQHGNKLHAIALKDGFIPMGLDGLVKALRGETTVQEVLRALP